MAWN
jgi:hypothetical protein